MPTTQFPSPDLSAQLTTLQGQMSTLQSSVNAIPTTSSGIFPTKPYYVGAINQDVSQNTYVNVLGVTGKGCVGRIGVYGTYFYNPSWNVQGVNSMAVRVQVDGGSYYEINWGSSQAFMDNYNWGHYTSPIYFNSSIYIAIKNYYSGSVSQWRISYSIDYSLV